MAVAGTFDNVRAADNEEIRARCSRFRWDSLRVNIGADVINISMSIAGLGGAGVLRYAFDHGVAVFGCRQYGTTLALSQVIRPAVMASDSVILGVSATDALITLHVFQS